MSKQCRYINFIYHDWKASRVAPLISYPRYLWFLTVSRFPTIYYDKTFTSSYQPFSTRNNILLLLGTVFLFKYNISQRKSQGLDQESNCCCCCFCPKIKSGCSSSGCKTS